MIRLAIIGAGDLALQIEDHALQNEFKIIGFFDDYKKKGDEFGTVIILGGLQDVYKNFQNGLFSHVIIAIGYKHLIFKEKISEQLKQVGIPFISVISKNSIINPSANIKPGCFILPGCIIDKNVQIGVNSILNCGCILSHDSIIKKNSFLGPGVILAGFASIGEACFIGMGSKIIDSVLIDNNIRTGAGTLVIKNLVKKGLYLGTPAKWIKE